MSSRGHFPFIRSSNSYVSGKIHCVDMLSTRVAEGVERGTKPKIEEGKKEEEKRRI